MSNYNCFFSKWFFWLDIDTIIVHPERSMHEVVLNEYAKPDIHFIGSHDCKGGDSLNLGVFMIRNSAWSRNSLRYAYETEWNDMQFGLLEQDTFMHMMNLDDDIANHTVRIPMKSGIALYLK